MVTPALLRGVDRGAFAVAFAYRLRAAGVSVGLTDVEAFTAALGVIRLDGRSRVYWAARTTLLRRHTDLETFDAVFAAVFDDADFDLDPWRGQTSAARQGGEDAWPTAGPGGPEDVGGGLPWVTLPRTVRAGDLDGEDQGQPVPQRLPSGLEAVADIPFEDLDESDVALIESWIRASLPGWPVRRSRRLTPHATGRRVELRSTLRLARRTGWEPVELVRRRPKTRPRRVVMVCDVSQSMRAYTSAYLHLMRAAALLTPTEVFAFSTRLTRLTAVLAHHSPTRSVQLATERVEDRFGGTRIASNLASLLRSRHGMDLRGAVVMIASDGWDSDEPGALAAVMARLRRRVHRVVWVNPRAAAPDFAPLAGGMAAALPYCDELLPGHTLRSLADVVTAITRTP